MATSKARSAIFIVGAKRTAFGSFGGKVKNLSATELAVHSTKGALASGKVDPAHVNEVFFGNVSATSLDATYLARHVALKSGIPQCTPALTMNRLCGSGFEAVCLGAEAIDLQRAKVTLCGGTENMSQAPMVIDGVSARWGTPLGKGLDAKDSLWAGLTDSYTGMPMGITAENLATQYNISREMCDEYAVRSQVLHGKASAAGIYAREITPIEIKGRKGTEVFDKDEHPRHDTTLEGMQKLKPVFKKDGVVTAAGSSGICDGAASLIVASEEACTQHGYEPLSRVLAWSRVGCDPSVMGIGPVDAIKNVLSASGLTLADIDLVEINEAFAAQYLACEKALGLDRDRVNVNGGAIALGHPLGASGARILTHLSHELSRTGKKYSVGAACIGGGQGIAVLLQNAKA